MPNILLAPLTYTVSAGEHNGHVDEFGSPLPHNGNIEGTFATGSPKLLVGGSGVLLEGDTSTEICFDDGGGTGTMDAISCKVKVGNKFVAISGSKVVTHAGVEKVLTGGNSKVSIGGI